MTDTISSTFKTWKRIKIGTGTKTDDNFRTTLRKADCYINPWGYDILGKPAFTVADQEKEVELIIVTVAKLALKNGATYKDIYTRAIALGLNLCPAEVGPQLRLQYKDQLKYECLFLAMEPITDTDGDPSIFVVMSSNKGKLCLKGYYGNPDNLWPPDFCLVFMRSR
jgi:hypothetical protein